jgi:hypothetical protein
MPLATQIQRSNVRREPVNTLNLLQVWLDIGTVTFNTINELMADEGKTYLEF